MESPELASQFKDRHGRLRWRFRKGGRDVYLPGNPGEEAFRLAYDRALSGEGRERRERRSSVASAYIVPALKRAKTRAKSQNVPFSLDAAFMKDLMDRQGWKCAVSGIAFPMERTDDRSKQAFRPSIDRRVPSVGYVPENVRIVCEIVNLAMNNWGEGPLRELAGRMRKQGVST